jgi:hypothetical protein
LTRSAGRMLLEKARFSVVTEETHPLQMLEPRTVLTVEGVGGTLAILAVPCVTAASSAVLVEFWRTLHRTAIA